MSCLLDDCQAFDLVEVYGSPLYIFHIDDFKETFIKLLEAVRAYYPKYNIAYSYKTNYTPRICEVVKELGGLAEVVSDMEFTLARQIGYESNRIIYNGPVKGDGLLTHLRNGGVVNIDSLDELSSVLSFAGENYGMPVHIAFRVNIDVGQGYISSFGLDAYEDEDLDRYSELNHAFKLVNSLPNVHVVGLHCHIGKSRSIIAWHNRIRIMFKLIDRYFDGPPEFIDFGSGMNSVMEPILAKQFSDDIPTFAQYAEVIGKAMFDKYGNLPESKMPLLYTEPGTTLISGCVSFLSSVKSIKTVKNKVFVTFDCSGGNLGDICRLKRLPISVFHNDNISKSVVDASFVGYTCLEHDIIYEGYTGAVAVGDIVQYRNVGSYSNVFKPPFILPNCAMIALENNGHTEVIKRSETFADIFRTYVF